MYYPTFNDFIEQSGRFKGLELGQTAVASILFTDDYLDDDHVYDEREEAYLPWVMYCYENVSHALNSLGDYCKKHYPQQYHFMILIGSDQYGYFCHVRLAMLTKTRDVDPQLN